MAAYYPAEAGCQKLSASSAPLNACQVRSAMEARCSSCGVSMLTAPHRISEWRIALWIHCFEQQPASVNDLFAEGCSFGEACYADCYLNSLTCLPKFVQLNFCEKHCFDRLKKGELRLSDRRKAKKSRILSYQEITALRLIA